VLQTVTERGMKVGPVMKGVHLVDPDALETIGAALDGVEKRHRLAVRERHDQIGAPPDEADDGVRSRRSEPRTIGHETSPGIQAKSTAATRRGMRRPVISLPSMSAA
jgi:hypothetical protein